MLTLFIIYMFYFTVKLLNNKLKILEIKNVYAKKNWKLLKIKI